MTNTQKDSGDELRQVRALIDAAVENGTELALQTAALAIVQLIEAREREAEKRGRIDELRLLAAEVNLSKPRSKFVYNKYLRIAYFNERMAQLTQPKPQAGEGGEV